MTATLPDSRPSLAELRRPCEPDEKLSQEAIHILCDIAEAAQALDKRNTSHDLDEALAKVAP